MKLLKTTGLFLIILCIVILFSGCTLVEYLNEKYIEGIASSEGFEDFLSFEQGDMYTCTINDDVSFWYSPIDMYGEWTSGDTIVPVKLTYQGIGQPRVDYSLSVDFFDRQGCRIGVLRMCMSDNAFNSDTTAKQSKCLNISETKVLNTEYQKLFEELFADLTLEGAIIRKEKREVSSKDSVFQPLLSWGDTDCDEILHCVEGGFWFWISSGEGYWYGNPITTDVLKFKISSQWTNFDERYYADQDLMGGYYSESCVKLYMMDYVDNSVLTSYEIFADQAGYYIWLESEEEPIKARLTKATADTNPRRDFAAFMQGEDESGNAFTFTCEQGGFSFTGRLGIGIWEGETEKADIKVSKGDWPLEICVSLISNELTGDIILKADFVEMTDENTAKFRIRSEFLGGKVFPDSKQAEFYVTKQAASE